MKVLSVSNYYPKNYSAKVERTNYGANNNTNNTSFKGWNVKVLDLSQDSLNTVAKHFYKSSEEELKEVTKETFMGIKRKHKSLAGYYKLKAAVDKAKLDVDSIKSMIKMVKSKPDKTTTDKNSLAMLKSQLKEYETAFKTRKDKYYTYPVDTSSLDNDLDFQVQLAKSDGSWYDY